MGQLHTVEAAFGSTLPESTHKASLRPSTPGVIVDGDKRGCVWCCSCPGVTEAEAASPSAVQNNPPESRIGRGPAGLEVLGQRHLPIVGVEPTHRALAR
jgi:hypothetical protein